MSSPSSDRTDAEPRAESEPEPEPKPIQDIGNWALVALIADDGQEPAGDLSEAAALGAWCAVSALWHPALLAQAAALPRIENVDYPSPPGPNEVRVLAAGSAERLPSGYRTQAADAGTILIEAGSDRAAMVREVLDRMGLPAEADDDGMQHAAALDYHALGTARWWIRDLTIAMGHADMLDAESLAREVLSGAVAWQSGDTPAATNRLRAAFELLTQARERFYPVDAYLIDLCLVDPNMPGGALQGALEARAPVTFVGPGRAIENQAINDPDRIAALRQAISEGWADVAGGAYDEAEEGLLPLESILWQFRRGGEAYRRQLDDRNVETLARRRFGLYPHLPQIAKRFGFRFGVHLGFDAGRFPIRPESKRLWESPDGSSLEALMRPPLGADRAVQGLHLPWRLAQSMKDDHVATVGLVHWPSPVAAWYLDLRRVAAYSPVLARWVTLNDYFHLTDRPFESFRPQPDDYVTPYLAQAIARRDSLPISRRAVHARLRGRFASLGFLRALAQALAAAAGAPSAASDAPELSFGMLEEAIETGRLAEADSALGRHEPLAATGLVQAVVGTGGTGPPGYFVFNSLSFPRRAAVLLPGAAADLRATGPLRAAQFTEEGVWAVVDLPAFGYAWVSRDTDHSAPPTAPGAVSARDRVLRNESLEIEIDKETGGIRGLHAPGEPTARLGQQLAIADAPGSKMHADSFEVEYGGPALVQAVARGTIAQAHDQRPLASFRQRYRLWTGRPILELEIVLDDLDPRWLETRAGDGVDPWSRFLSCRWAWPDPNSMLRRTCLLAPELTEAERPETPDAIDISTRRQRTALLVGGLAHHTMHGTRMLDTLLIAGRETARVFNLGVALDLEYPFHAALDLVTPAVVVPTDTGPPRSGPSGWFLQLDNRAVAITRVEYIDSSGDGRGWGLAVHLVETAGRPARCHLRFFRDPLWARQTDFNHELIVELPLDGDAVQVDLTPHEIARVDVTLG
jgi:alpha-mannosidase